ncbi:carbohydrate ABC transporter permease [Enterococcus cecorum]|uniref:Carbohydrate ABC transporter permease n=2 Tax=Enterococcus cecorum TaxID=44008 RepID=A0AAW9JUL2_9ENTE|nr:carbohydrate ABC transporter permease [Enterococcus cecorum]MCJ0574351.1 carbohydrate ABC transporter permease [Enterococcus cecorum]MCJ0575961.1 carbohydrate ABC transporter permease [Enterococcus cecorum]MDZ5505218.1 carbohydrate ABC transporter permease [Enterococcus cecorum]MDZ5532666.1 carbohydrate ABC transporter permease [Enterococcus cecorum]MDZ5578687.1 carbohydrate ABC transporter permease [Enterococcus cecorum]
MRIKKTNWLTTAIIAFLALGVVIPIYMALNISLKSPSEMTTNISDFFKLPKTFQFSNYTEAISVTNFFQSAANSILITVFSVIVVVILTSIISYAIARNMHKKGYKYVYYYLVSAMFVPFAMLMLPLVKQLSFLKIDNMFGLIVMYFVFQLSLGVLLYVGYLKNITVSLDEAAYMDGANEWQIFWKIIFPLLKPMHATVAILTALASWNDLLLPLVVLSGNGSTKATLPMAQLIFQSQFGTNYNLAFASYVLALLPMLIFYLFAQKQIISGVINGAVK